MRPLDDVDLASRYGRVTDYVVDQLPDTTITALFVASGVTCRSVTTRRSTPRSRRS